ncbi:MAG TPA: hypothetical protein VFX02_10735 [Gammaproteobacteria bacterium]|nr:hypothetical protein [Gammaproteobacteria bacterium]
MKNIFIAMTFIGAGLLPLEVSAAGPGGAPTFFRGYTLTNSLVCNSSNGVKQAYNPGFDYYGYFNVDDYTGSTIKYQQYAYYLSGYPSANTLEKLTFHYANGSSFNRVMNLVRRDTGEVLAANIQFPYTGGWDGWNDITLWVDIGGYGQANRFNLVSVSPEGGPDINWIRVDYETYACPPGVHCMYNGYGTGGTTSCY